MMTQISKQRRVAGRGGGKGPAASPREAGRALGEASALVNPGLFRALGDPTRARILACLCQCSRACAVSEIAECCSVDLSVVSRHLSVLERAGVLEARKQGRAVLYRVHYEVLVGAFRRLAEAVEMCRVSCGDGGVCCGDGGCGTTVLEDGR